MWETKPIGFDTFSGIVVTKNGHVYAGLICQGVTAGTKDIKCFPPHHKGREIVTIGISDIRVWMALPTEEADNG